MADLFDVLYTIISPIFVIVAITWFLDRRLGLDPKPLSRLLIYVFSPCLVLDGIAHTQMGGGEAIGLVAVAMLASVAMAVVGVVIARLWGFERRLASAFIVSVVLINAGNYGIPLNRLAFGAPGEERAVIYFTATYIVTNTLGVFLAARGSRSTWESVRTVLFIPLPYAVILGVVLNLTNSTLPVPLDRAVSILAPASIPGMLAVLGIQLSRASIRGQILPIIAAAGSRLLISPLIALILVVIFGLSGLTRQVSIVQAAMPSAVMGSVLMTEFGGDSDFVTAVILLSTLASAITLSVLLLLLGWHG